MRSSTKKKKKKKKKRESSSSLEARLEKWSSPSFDKRCSV